MEKEETIGPIAWHFTYPNGIFKMLGAYPNYPTQYFMMAPSAIKLPDVFWHPLHLTVKYSIMLFDFLLTLYSICRSLRVIYSVTVFCFYWPSHLISLLLSSTVIISRQQRRVQLMRIKQREERKEKKKKKRRPHPHPHLQHKAHPPEPAYRRKPNPVRRFDGDVLSPVSDCQYSQTYGGVLRLCWEYDRAGFRDV